MEQFFIEFFLRLRSSSPIFFVKLRKGMVILGIIAAAVKVLIVQHVWQMNVTPAQTLQDILSKVLLVIGTVTGVSFLPTNNPTLMDNATKQAVLKQALENGSVTMGEDIMQTP